MKLNFGILFLMFFSNVLASPISLKDEKTPFSIEETVLNGLPMAQYSGVWISDTEIRYQDKDTKDVKVLNVAKNQTAVVLKASILEKYNSTKFSFSPDGKFVLITYDVTNIYRYSKTSRFVVYSLKDGNFYDVSKKELLQTAEWGGKHNTLLYIKNNNIYVIPTITGKMEFIQITHDGKPGIIFNGWGDWVYEEEILHAGKAYWFSPSGDQLVFASFCAEKVKKVLIPKYGEPGDLKDQYEEQDEIAYPKPGTTNPTYELRYVLLNDTKKIISVTKSSLGKEVFYGLKWHENDLFTYIQTNRVQNESKMFGCFIGKTLDCEGIFENKCTKGWANTNFLHISKDRYKLFRIEGLPVGKLGNFAHLMFYSSSKNYSLTRGVYEVTGVDHWDEDKEIIYYSATEELNSTTSQVFAVNEKEGSKPVCLTCRIKSPEGRGCKWASASFSSKSSYVIVTCSGPDPRVVYLYKNVQPFDKPLAILEDNAKFRSSLKKKLLPEIMNLTVDIPGPFKADVRLYLPPKMDRSGKTKYPMIIYVYGGPSSKQIRDSFQINWGHYISTNLSVIYGMIDGRNTLRKGENMLFAGYRALGTLEMIDQINVTRTLQKTFTFIDPSKTAIWGWSYGGYATTKILEMDTQNVFNCGLAVAPVADWIYYNTMYTERYMGLVSENLKGYEKSSVLKDVSNLRNKKYFLIHGNADDNVHYQNAMMIARKLEKNNIPFELMSYPDENHSLGGVSKHLYYTMDRFWKKCFNICC